MKQTGFVIVDLPGLTLTSEDKELLQHPLVAGIILFTRNYENPKQLRALTHQINQVRPHLIIAADQEGGRVQRFREGFTEIPSMGSFGKHWQQAPQQTEAQLRDTITTAAHELRGVGVNVNFAPVLDMDYQRNQVIGERSFGDNTRTIITLAKITIEALRAAHMPAVGKHFPGHGGVTADSHETLPIDSRPKPDILAQDLVPFAQLLPDLDAVMPAHVIYTAFDDQPACFSRYWLTKILREQLKFSGVVISDDLTMQGAAAMGSYEERASRALEAGCDLLTVCNNRKGAETVIDALSHYRHAESLRRIQEFIVKCDFRVR